MNSLTSQLAQMKLESIPPENAARYYRHFLREIPTTFKPLSAAERSNPRVQGILEHYSSWFDAQDNDLCDESAPKDALTSTVLSKAMVETIVARARDGDSRLPPQSPQDHPCCPFWSRPEKDDWWLKEHGEDGRYGSDVLADLD